MAEESNIAWTSVLIVGGLVVAAGTIGYFSGRSHQRKITAALAEKPKKEEKPGEKSPSKKPA